MAEYMKELDVLYSMQVSGSKMCKKQDLLFAFIKSDSVIIDVKTLQTTADPLPLEKGENEWHDY